MSYNLVRRLPRHGFRGLDTLETVDLSYNDIREVDERAFEDMRWLTTLKVRVKKLISTRKSEVEGWLMNRSCTYRTLNSGQFRVLHNTCGTSTSQLKRGAFLAQANKHLNNIQTFLVAIYSCIEPSKF